MEGDRDVTGSVVRALVDHLRRALGGEDAMDAVLAVAGLDPRDRRLADDLGWFSAEEVARLADAAAVATGDPEVGRRVGEQYFRRDRALGQTEFLEAEGDPGAAIGLAVAQAGRVVPARTTTVTSRGEREVVVESVPSTEPARHRFHCDAVMGHWVQIPTLFGAAGTAVQPTCAARGDDRCRMVIRWDESVTPQEEELLRRRQRGQDMVHRFEQLQDMAADLAAVDDLDVALRRIVERAGSTLLAQRFLVTVRARSDLAPHVVASGLTRDEAERAAAVLWDGDEAEREQLRDHGVPVIAAIGAGDAQRGYLVAFLPIGTTVRESDSRLLDAYAGHASATVDRILTTAAAHREHRTADALLGLAHSLAGARTVAEATELVTDAVREVTACEVSGVWLLDPDGTRYHLQVVREEGATPGPREMPVLDPVELEEMAADPQPFAVRGEAPEIIAIHAGWGVEESYVAPIVHRGRLYGLLSAARRIPCHAAEQPWLLSTVSALAHLAATAIANAELLDEIRHQATHDALTGLPNRPQIEQQAVVALRLAEERGTTVALAFVDLDRFKIVNDTLGHVAGDHLIGRVADRLESHLRPSDAVARLGGDEFLVLLTDLADPCQAEEVASRMLDALREPFEVGGELLYVTASVGLACSPQHGTDYGVLFRRADAAMYVAKGEGRNRVAVHRSAVTGRRSRLKLESELHHAAERDELRVVYQPQVDLLTDDIVAVEALVRWQHPSLGLVGPATFLTIAEDSGIVVDIDRWVRQTAFTQAAAWAAADTPVRLAVNVSRRDLADATFAGTVRELMAQTGLPAQLVELEITDRIVMSDEDLPPSMAGLRSLGVRLAVDDFGTGSSVLSRLHHCPVDVLKVDRTFVEPLARPRPDTRLVDGLVSMAHALGMEVVIEGIEDEQQAHAVRLLGADLAQGFWFHRPMPADELTPLLALQAATAPAGAPGLVRRKVRGARR